MAKFVAIKTIKRAQKIERSGRMKAHKSPVRFETDDPILKFILWKKVIFAMPVSTNYVLSHQWIAEMSRWYRHVPVSAVYFEIPDDWEVYYGHFAAAKQTATAAEVCGYFYDKIQADDISSLAGFEVQIPCDFVDNISRVKHRVKRVGWRRDPKIMVTDLDAYRRTYMSPAVYKRYAALKYN